MAVTVASSDTTTQEPVPDVRVPGPGRAASDIVEVLGADDAALSTTVNEILVAITQGGGVVLTGDVADIERLAAPHGAVTVAAVNPRRRGKGRSAR